MRTTTDSSARPGFRARHTRHFGIHYLKMVGVMFAGMAVLALPAGWLLGAFGSSWNELSTGPMLVLMAATMTLPMVPYMRWMGHGWRPTLEMAASMIVPSVGVLILLASGLVTGEGALLVIEHVAMFIGMWAVMVARPEEYSGHGHDSEPAYA